MSAKSDPASVAEPPPSRPSPRDTCTTSRLQTAPWFRCLFESGNDRREPGCKRRARLQACRGCLTLVSMRTSSCCTRVESFATICEASQTTPARKRGKQYSTSTIIDQLNVHISFGATGTSKAPACVKRGREARMGHLWRDRAQPVLSLQRAKDSGCVSFNPDRPRISCAYVSVGDPPSGWTALREQPRHKNKTTLLREHGCTQPLAWPRWDTSDKLNSRPRAQGWISM